VIWGFIHSTLACIIYTYRDTVPSDLGIREVWAGSPDPTPVDPHETCRREVNWKNACLSVSYQLLTLPKQLVSEPEYTLSAFLYFKDNYLFTQIWGICSLHPLYQTSSLKNAPTKISSGRLSITNQSPRKDQRHWHSSTFGVVRLRRFVPRLLPASLASKRQMDPSRWVDQVINPPMIWHPKDVFTNSIFNIQGIL